MEILLLFSCFILAIIIGVIWEIKPKNQDNIHFYVARDKNGDLWLYMGKPFRGDTKFYPDIKRKVFCLTYNIDSFGLKHEDFDYLKWKDEPVEVFLNMED